MDSHEWFFIEMNPRIQVEHTVTEVITDIDLVRAQIQVAEGRSLHDEVMALPAQDKIPRLGWALQCRITTEDPEKNFTPDYGKIVNYRSAAGFGIRLDGAMGDTGAVITPFYDSLLVKVTASGPTFEIACQRMDRALREMRIRGVKTNLPFLENVINHPDFPQRPGDHEHDREHARAVPLLAPPGPRDQAAQVFGRRHRQRQRAGQGPARCRSSRCRSSCPNGTAGRRRRPARATSCASLGPKNSRNGCSRKSACS